MNEDRWDVANRRALGAAFALIAAHVARARAPGARPEAADDEALPALERALVVACEDAPPMPGFMRVELAFGLTRFERDVLLLCAGMELDPGFAERVGATPGQPGHALRRPTFALALASLPEAHWGALAPTAALRWFNLITLAGDDSLTRAPLRIDERILNVIAGVSHLDERLLDCAELFDPDGAEDDPEVHAITTALTRPPLVIVELVGPDAEDMRVRVIQVARELGRRVLRVVGHTIPSAFDEALLARLLTREAMLEGALVWLDADRVDGDAGRAMLARVAERLGGGFIVSAATRLALRGPVRTFELDRPDFDARCRAWQRSLAEVGLRAAAAEGVEAIAMQFDLPERGRLAAALRARGELAPATPELASIDVAALWGACRIEARPRLDQLALRVETRATWSDLIVSDTLRELLVSIALEVRHRATVYERWRMSQGGARGVGVTALFAGPSGTGKTLAAEVLATELGLDLYRIDLSQVVSKYIGETEKNLRRVFDAAEEGGSVLLFDEADALFGKRTDVKDSHDRYANIEVSYLLQRMEAYRGLALLTTNFKAALDAAFVRRLRFIVSFPFPGPSERRRIWQRMFSGAVPTDGLDLERLARLNVPGGNIRNIALGAAFRAAAARGPIGMDHVLAAAHAEYAKLEKSMTELDPA